jgi:cytochrome c biogenesis protein CcdA
MLKCLNPNKSVKEIEVLEVKEFIDRVEEKPYSMVGLGIAGLCFLGGIILLCIGITGSINWITSFLGLKSEIVTTAPGTILIIVGLFIAFITRPKRMKKIRKYKRSIPLKKRRGGNPRLL